MLRDKRSSTTLQIHRAYSTALADLCYQFLTPLLPLRWCLWLLQHRCSRTDKRSQTIMAPLYRLRCALARLWLTHHPSFSSKIRFGMSHV